MQFKLRLTPLQVEQMLEANKAFTEELDFHQLHVNFKYGLIGLAVMQKLWLLLVWI